MDPASPLDLVRIFDYPGDFVPVIVEQVVAETEQQRCHVIDKSALSVQLARAYMTICSTRATPEATAARVPEAVVGMVPIPVTQRPGDHL